MQRSIFCANDQVITEQTLSVDPVNGEIVATCPCGRFLKFPSSVTPDSFTELLTAHEDGNKGQVSVAAMNELVSSLANPEAPSEDQTQA